MVVKWVRCVVNLVSNDILRHMLAVGDQRYD